MTRLSCSILVWLVLGCLWTACARTQIPKTLPPSADPSIEAENRLWTDIAAAQGQGRHDVAIRTLRRLLATYPKSPRKAEGHWRLGQSLEQTGDTAAAVSEYQLLLEMEPLLLPAGSFQTMAMQRLDELRRQGVAPPAKAHGHTALLISPASVASLPNPGLWMQKTRASGVTVLMLDVSCDAACSERLRAVSSHRPEPVSARTGVLFATVHAPVVRPLMNDLVDEAHRAGLLVVAVMDLLRAPWLEGRIEWHTSVFDPRTQAMRPWVTLDLLNPSVHTHVAAVLSDLTTADIDGILIRTRSRNSFAYEMGEEALAGFQAQYQESRTDVAQALIKAAGPPPPVQPRPEEREGMSKEQPAGTLWHWVGWKARQELDALAQLRRTLQQVRHGVRIILEVHPEAASEPLSALVNYGEDVAEASRRGFDILLNGQPRVSELQQLAALVKHAEMKALRKPVIGQPSTQQLWVLAPVRGLTSSTDSAFLLQHADRLRVREDVNVLLVPDPSERSLTNPSPSF
ncbi:MAG TPA: tetratricopeptide repeat protein [Nitrospiraceae bacterium]|nr:tetratricopeptide repeat protein [Nitrospiraceae bacterium]